MFTQKDIDQIVARGTEPKDIDVQIRYYKKGFPSLHLVKPATFGDGIIAFDINAIQKVIDFYNQTSAHKTVLKFVPASGAASRMFKNLQEFRNSNHSNEEAYKLLSIQTAFDSPGNFFKKLPHFSFYQKDIYQCLFRI